MKIVILDGHVAIQKDLSYQALSELGEVIYYPRTAPSEVVEHAADAEVVITNKVEFDAALMDQLPHLRYIGVVATGYNIIDLEAARERGITVTNVPAYSTDSVAQTTFALLLHITHHVAEHAASVNAGDWQRCTDFCYTLTPILELAGRTFAIAGLGNIGLATARIAQAMGMKVLALSSKTAEELAALGIEKAADRDDLFSRADVLSLHCPLTEETRQMANAHTLSLMRPTSILLNTSRGGLVDEAALAAALNEGRLLAAGLDVLGVEAPREGNPLIGARHCYITPHIAWASREARTRLVHVVYKNLKNYLAGTPINVVS